MVAGVHALLYVDDADAARAFLRDVLGFRYVDSGEGWLIFALPPAELGVHPGPGWGRAVGDHELFLMCHDLERTVDELKGKGVEFVSAMETEDWGRSIRFRLPGGGEMGLYQPTHASPLAEFAVAKHGR
jgi:catechol 2,3-dioxygenase-like lactoylglutathione lyase family enzyme